MHIALCYLLPTSQINKIFFFPLIGLNNRLKVENKQKGEKNIFSLCAFLVKDPGTRN